MERGRKADKKQADERLHVTPAALVAAVQGDFVNATIAMTPGGIEQQEARGQIAVVTQKLMPRYADGRREPADDVYKKLGIVIIGEHDDILVKVKLPDGWKLEPTEDSMWSDLRDNKGRKRAQMFYKAAFYDRRANLNLVTRFSRDVVPKDRYKTDISYEKREKMPWLGVVQDCEKDIFTTKPVKLTGDFSKDESLKDKLLKRCDTYLQKKFPNWKDQFAYWN
ncbi:MAG: hypothetical protein V1887_01200 [Candidatus Aenigmatarchaeota archaeon]